MSPDKQSQKDKPLPVGLQIVGTPIGNLEDVTLRALRILREADLIAAEDTRRTRKLLSHYDIHTPLVSYHEHNKQKMTLKLISKLKEGAVVALVSDAGMPGISDPGQELIGGAIDEGLQVSVVPGPSSILSALVLSGLSTRSFSFAGFLPRKKGERAKKLREVLSAESTAVIFESPNRLVALLEAIAEFAPERTIAVARELTKKFEQVVRGTASEALERFKEKEPRGECVVVLEGAGEVSADPSDLPPGDVPSFVERLMQEKGLSKKEAMRRVAKKFNISRREVYKQLLDEEAG